MIGINRRIIENSHWSQWLGILGLAALFLVLRWNNFDAPLGRDEGEYAYSAQLLIQGITPYQHAFIQKPPMVIYSYTLSELILPHVFWSPRLLSALFEVGATMLIGFIAWLEFGKGMALPAMWLVTPMMLLPGLEQVAANVEMFMLLPLLGTVAVYCYSRQNGHKKNHWFLAGFLTVTTLLYKYTAAPILAYVFVLWLWEAWRDARVNVVRAAGYAMAGGILAIVAELLFYLIHDGGKTFWECTVVFNRCYAETANFGLSYFWEKCGEFWHSWRILFLMPWAIFLKARPRIWFWVGIFGCSVLATNGSIYGQYYVMMMPFWALLNVAGIRALASRISESMPKLSFILGFLITAVVVLMVISPDVSWLRLTREQFASEKMAESPFIEAQLVADQVSRMSSPDDSVYVAGSEPEILYYAQRFSPTRFITSYPLMIPTPLATGYQQEAIRDLESHPPKWIVFVQAGNSWLRQSGTPPFFLDFMGKVLMHYDITGGYVKKDLRAGYWTTHLSPDEYRSASLILYKLKADGSQP